MNPKYADLAAKVRKAIEIGRAAADATLGDGGSANLDHVVLTEVKGAREDTLSEAFGTTVYKQRGCCHFALSFGGQGEKRYVGTQAMWKSLSEAGVPCYVHYQID